MRKTRNLKLCGEVAVLLVGDGLDGGGVDRARAVLRRQRKGVFGHHRFPCTGVGGDKDRVALRRVHLLIIVKLMIGFNLVLMTASRGCASRLPRGIYRVSKLS